MIWKRVVKGRLDLTQNCPGPSRKTPAGPWSQIKLFTLREFRRARLVVCVSVGRVDVCTCDASELRVSGSLGGKVGELG